MWCSAGHRPRARNRCGPVLAQEFSAVKCRQCVWGGGGLGSLAPSCANSPCANRPYLYWGKGIERLRHRTTNPSPEEPLLNQFPARATVPHKDLLMRFVIVFLSSSPERPAGALTTISRAPNPVSLPSAHCLQMNSLPQGGPLNICPLSQLTSWCPLRASPVPSPAQGVPPLPGLCLSL